MPKQPFSPTKQSIFRVVQCALLIFAEMQCARIVAETPPPVAVNFRAGIGATEGQGIAVGSNGVIYATGQYVGTGTFGAFTLTNGGAEDYYLAAYNPTGQVLWAQRTGSTGSDFGSDVIVDNDGNVVVVGVVQGTNDFHGVTNVIGFGNKDIFLAKYLPDGTLAWVQLAGGTDNDDVSDVAVDGSGNYFVAGRIRGIATFGNTNIGSASANHCFLAKYNSDGQLVWASDVGGTGSTETSGVAADADGNSYITGLSTSPAGPFVAKYDSSGAQLWKTVAPGHSYFDEGSSVAVDASGNVYVAGRFSDASLDFGVTTISNTGGFPLGFIAKFDPSGTALWAEKAGARAFDVFAKSDGTLYITGFSSTTATNVGDVVLSANQGGLDFYAAKIDSLGNVIWVKDAGTGGNDIGRAVAQSASDSTFVIGEGGSELFDNFPGGVFVAELRPTVVQPSVSVGISGTNLIVSWPADLSGYAIETTTSLGTAFQQGAVPFTPVPGETNAYSTPKPTSNLFIRLTKP